MECFSVRILFVSQIALILGYNCEQVYNITGAVQKQSTDLLKASVSLSALKSRENAFPKTGIAVKRGPGGMLLNS